MFSQKRDIKFILFDEIQCVPGKFGSQYFLLFLRLWENTHNIHHFNHLEVYNSVRLNIFIVCLLPSLLSIPQTFSLSSA